MDGIGCLLLARRPNGGGGRGGAVNHPSAGPSLGAETAGQTATADQGDDDDEDDDPNDDSHKFQNAEDINILDSRKCRTRLER